MWQENTTMTQQEVIQRILDEVERNGGSKKKTAEQMGISPAYLGDVLKCRRDIGQSILNALGLEKVTEYRQKDKSAEDALLGERAAAAEASGNVSQEEAAAMAEDLTLTSNP
jgi:hypothetical protein